jgi:hypothetical protein
MPRRLEPRIVALETQVAATDTTAILVGAITEAELEALFQAGIQAVFVIPDNKRDRKSEQWQRSRLE